MPAPVSRLVAAALLGAAVLPAQSTPDKLDPRDGAFRIADFAAFDALSRKDRPGYRMDRELQDQHVVKFVIIQPGTKEQKIYYQNTKNHTAHPRFMSAIGIGGRGGFGRGRGGGGGVMRGQLIYRARQKAPNGEIGLFSHFYQPRDSHPTDLVLAAHALIEETAPVTKGRLAYTPRERMKDLYEQDKARFDAAGIQTYYLEDGFKGIGFLPLNPGVGYGRLRLMQGDERPGPRDVVIFTSLPNELSRVAGILTSVRQTPLSHVNLRAVQDKVPNAFLDKAHENPKVRALLGKYVRFAVTPDGFELTQAQAADVEKHFAALRPATAQVPVRDLSVRTIRPLADVEFADSTSVGVKAANLAALRSFLPPAVVPDGYAVPFAFYDEFMESAGLYDAARKMQESPGFAADADVRRKALAELQQRIRKAPLPAWMAEALAVMRQAFPKDRPLRCRSSTNNEDLPGFSGAGLYDSITHRPTDGSPIDASIKHVFASLWNFRAFEERAFYRIDHFQTAMGVLVHPNFDEERVNGVAVADDIVYGTGRKYYVNAQVGEDLVTNPEAQSIPEEHLLDPAGAAGDQIVQTSNRVKAGETVLSPAHAQELRKHLGRINRKFRRLYKRPRSAGKFAMEIEFKVTAAGEFVIKQARPWVY